MHYALVFLGGGIGAALRHAVNLAVARLGYVFPVGTLAVNVLGSVLMGVLVAWFALRTGTHEHVKLLLTTGLLGGFTTFSAFSLDSALLWERGAFAGLALYAGGSVVLAVAGLFVGMAAVRLLA
jgi:CrcB protein